MEAVAQRAAPFDFSTCCSPLECKESCVSVRESRSLHELCDHEKKTVGQVWRGLCALIFLKQSGLWK